MSLISAQPTDSPQIMSVSPQTPGSDQTTDSDSGPVPADEENQRADVSGKIQKTQKRKEIYSVSLAFDINNTFWHRLCRDEETAAKIILYTVSTPLTISIISLAILGTILNVTGVDESQRAFYLSYKLIVALMANMWALSIMLSVNVKAAKLVIKSMTFWIKALSLTQAVILHFLLAHYFQFWDDGQRLNLNGLAFMADMFLTLAIFALIMVLCFIDGLHLKRKWKVLASGILTIDGCLYTIVVIFNSPKEDETVINIGTLVSYSAYSGYSSAVLVLCLFVAQSSWRLIRHPEKCANIMGKRPLLKWK